MKKYTILDAKCKKTIVYAPNMKKALRYVGDGEKAIVKDSKVRDIDASSLMTLFTKYGKPYDYVCKTRPKMSSGSKYLGQLVSYTLSPVGKYDADKASDFVDFLNKKGYEAAIFAPNIVVTLKQDRSSGLYNRGHERTNQYDSKVKDVDLNVVDKLIAEEEKAVMDYKEALMADSDSFANDVYTHILAEELEHLRELRSLKEQSASDGNAVEKKLDDSKIADAYSAEHYVNTDLIQQSLVQDIIYDAQRHDDSFDTALKKFDSMASQVLAVVKEAINKAKKDMINWRRNYPNELRDSIEDSIHDGLSEAKDLVKQAGFKVVRVYGTDNEPYITVDWSGSYSELRKKVSELKSKAKAIGYNDVYADDNDICFSKY